MTERWVIQFRGRRCNTVVYFLFPTMSSGTATIFLRKRPVRYNEQILYAPNRLLFYHAKRFSVACSVAILYSSVVHLLFPCIFHFLQSSLLTFSHLYALSLFPPHSAVLLSSCTRSLHYLSYLSLVTHLSSSPFPLLPPLAPPRP